MTMGSLNQKNLSGFYILPDIQHFVFCKRITCPQLIFTCHIVLRNSLYITENKEITSLTCPNIMKADENGHPRKPLSLF